MQWSPAAPRRAAALLPVALSGALAACGEPEIEAPVAGGVPMTVAVPAAANSLAPRLVAAPSGGALMSWLEPEGDGHVLKHAAWQGDAWGAPGVIARGEDWAVSQADIPAVVPITAERWVAHWLVTSGAGYLAYDIAAAVSTDGGRTFSSPILLNDDGTAAEHGFVSWFDWDGAIGGVWLDGRDLAVLPEEGDEARFVGTSLRYARLGDDGQVMDQGVIDDVACDCCQTDVATGTGGPLVVYRDRAEDERRDVVVRRLVAGAWSAPIELGPDEWIIAGCPVNGPAIDARGAAVAVAWFTAPGNRPKVRAARSSDGGATFGAAVDVDGSGSFGHVGVALLDPETAIVSWWRSAAGGGTDLVAQAVGSDGVLGERRVVAHAAASRPTDVPQMVAVGRRLLFAWTDPAAGVQGAYLDWP